MDREYDIDGFPHKAALLHLYDDLLAEGRIPVIVDCGANIGMSAVWFRRKFPRAVIVAIEPEAENYALLVRNTADDPNTIAIRAAVWDRTTEVRIADDKAEPWGFQVQENAGPSGQDRIETVTIEQVLQRIPGSALLIVKVDIEGAEEALFRSNTAWLAKTPLLIIELHDWMLPWKGTSRNFFKAVTGSDYDVVQKGENLFWFHPESSSGGVAQAD